MASRGAGGFESRVREFEPRDTLAQTFTYASTTGVFGAIFAGTVIMSYANIDCGGWHVLTIETYRYPEHHDPAESKLHGVLYPLRRHDHYVCGDGWYIRVHQELLGEYS